MATFTITLSGSAVVNGTKSWTVSDTDVQSLVNYLQVKYFTGGPGGSAPTPQQALLSWCQDWVTTTIGQVQNFVRAQASIAPITFA